MNRLANILIAGSEKTGTDRLCDLLSENDCNVLVCNGAEELTREARSGRPDLVIVQVKEDEPDGFAIVEALKSDSQLRNLPIVGWCANGDRSATGELFSRVNQACFEDLYLGPPEREEMLLRFRPLMRFSTQIAELRRRAALVREFGEKISQAPELSAETGDYSILVASCGTSDGDAVNAAMESTSEITECESLFEARDALFDGEFDASVISISGADAIGDVFEFCEEVRNNPRLFNLPIVVLARDDVPLNAAQALSSGASRFVRTPVALEELRFNLNSLAHLQRRRWKIYSEIQKTKGERTCDPETGAYNLEFQRAHLDRLTEEAREWQRHVTVLFFSLGDAVSTIQGEFGSKAASNMFAQVAHWIDRLVRLEDLTSRFDETEFCVALPDTPLEVAETVMRRVSGILSCTDFAIPDVYRPVQISVKMGAAELQADDDPSALIARAHENLV